MMNLRISRSAKLLFASAMLALSLGACAADPDLEPATADESALQSTAAQGDEAAITDGTSAELVKPIAQCCSYGAYQCFSNPDATADYDPPGCGTMTKPKALTYCRTHCGTACVDTGWLDACN